MINKLFGSKNLKTNASVNSFGRGRSSAATAKKSGDSWGLDALGYDETVDAWDTAAKDALRVPILAKAHDNHIEKSKYEIHATNPYGVESFDSACSVSPASNDDNCQAADTAVLVSGLGLYTKCADYGKKMEKLLSGYGLGVGIFGPDSKDNLSQIDGYSAWIVDVSDEEDCHIMDLLIDRCNDVPALFFSEQGHSQSSLEKLKGFIETAALN